MKLKLSGCLAAFMLCASAALSQSPGLDQKGKWDLSVWTGAETGEETTNSFAQAQIWLAGVAVGRNLIDLGGRGWRSGSFEYGFDFVPLFETYGNQRTHGVGIDPVILRWNSALHTTHLAPYIELSGGAVITPVNLPPGRTSSFNFTAKGGGGIYLLSRSHQAFDVGLHWSHISNANLGADNTEFNGILLTLAYHWYR
jgi:hypothetical protein